MVTHKFANVGKGALGLFQAGDVELPGGGGTEPTLSGDGPVGDRRPVSRGMLAPMRYDLDPERSTLEIHASSSIHPIETRTGVSGWIDCTPAPTAALTPPIRCRARSPSARRMRSGNPLIDREAERRLDVAHHPTVTAVLTSLVPADEDAAWQGEGELTFHGVTCPVAGILRMECEGAGLRLEGSAEIDVTDFGVQPPSLLLVKVHKEVRVDLRAIAEPG